MSIPINWDEYLAIAIKDLNAAGVRYTDLSDETKQRTTKLEHEIALYARHNDLQDFIMAVRDWRDLMIKDFEKEKE